MNQLVNTIAERLSLRAPQRILLKIRERITDISNPPGEGDCVVGDRPTLG